MIKKVHVGGNQYQTVMEFLITGYTLIADAPYLGRKAYVNLETNTIFIESKDTDFHLTHNVNGKPMIPLYASSFSYRPWEEEE